MVKALHSRTITQVKPQMLTGSFLGPLLFILYFASLEVIIESYDLNYIIYADDSQVYIIVNPEDRLTTITNLEKCLRHVQTFFADNMLSCNPKKTEIVHFHLQFSHPVPYSSIRNSALL